MELVTTDDDEQRSPRRDALRPYEQMLRMEIRQAVRELDRPARGLLLSAISTGLGVGVSVLLVAAVRSHAPGADEIAPLAIALVSANVYSIGFIIVVLGRMDLFTEFTTIAILPVLGGRGSVGSLARLWGWV